MSHGIDWLDSQFAGASSHAQSGGKRRNQNSRGPCAVSRHRARVAPAAEMLLAQAGISLPYLGIMPELTDLLGAGALGVRGALGAFVRAEIQPPGKAARESGARPD